MYVGETARMRTDLMVQVPVVEEELDEDDDVRRVAGTSDVFGP